MKRPSWQHLSLDEVAHACQQSALVRRADQPTTNSPCYELFRRAIEDDDQAAWSALHAQYFRLVAVWLGRAAAADDDLIEETFARFWRSLRGARLALRFGSLAAVLTYLRKCALSAQMDVARRAAREQLAALPESLAGADPPVDDAVLNDITQDVLHNAIDRWLQTHLQNVQERVVVSLSYGLGLSPAEIVQRHPDQFADVAEVHRIKERLLKRMRRSAELRALFETHIGKSA